MAGMKKTETALEDSAIGKAGEYDRRQFMKKAGKVAIAAPAVALLVSASLKPRVAHAVIYEATPDPDMDDL